MIRPIQLDMAHLTSRRWSPHDRAGKGLGAYPIPSMVASCPDPPSKDRYYKDPAREFEAV
jgi:hypothetical protein